MMKEKSSKQIFFYVGNFLKIEPEVIKEVWRFGGIYFTELLLLWIVTGGGSEGESLNFHLGTFELLNLEINVVLIQTFGFLIGAFYFGRYKGEKKEKESINRISNLRESLFLYSSGALASLIFFLAFKFEILVLSDWLFALARFVTCFGIAGGIGINLTIIALSTKKGKHSVPILLFTALGVLGTILCCLILYCFGDNYDVSIVLTLGTALGFYQWKKLNPNDFKAEEKRKYTNTYSYKIAKDTFWSRIVSFSILGLPTFYLAGILASHADIIVREWFPENNFLNPSSLFLGIQYLGFVITCILFSLPNTKLIPFRSLITTSRKKLLFIGTAFQAVFIIPFLFSKITFSPPAIYYILILFSGVGIGINWGILMILIFEQEEFQSAKTFAATIIPNLIRFSLVLILFLPNLLGTENCFNDNSIGELKMLGLLVYIPYIFTLIIFKDKGERKSRYLREDQTVKRIVNDIITQQKTNSIPINIGARAVIPRRLQELKDELRRKLQEYDFDLINFYYTNKSGKIEGNKLDENEVNQRTEAIRKIVKYVELKESVSLLNISTDKKMTCIILHYAKSELDNSINSDETYMINLKKSVENIIERIEQDFNLKFSEEKRSTLKEHFSYHQKACEKSDKDYFVYIIRPIEDMESISSYLVLLKSSHLGKETINSFQTFIDLALLKFSNHEQKRLLFLINELNNKIENHKKEKFELKKSMIEEQKQTLNKQIEMWRELIRDNQTLSALRLLSEYAKNNDLPNITNKAILLTSRWNRYKEYDQKGKIDNTVLGIELNNIISSLLEMILELPRS